MTERLIAKIVVVCPVTPFVQAWVSFQHLPDVYEHLANSYLIGPCRKPPVSGVSNIPSTKNIFVNGSDYWRRCSCLSRPFARPYTPFAKAGGLQVFINILSSLTTLPLPPATSTTQPISSSPASSAIPTPTPDITDTVTCFTRGDGKGANYLSDMNSKNPVTNLCFGADSSTDIKSGASWIPNCSLWWPASAGWPEWCNNGMYIFFNIPADAPPICQTPTPDRGTFCTTPLGSILAACKLHLFLWVLYDRRYG